MRGRSYLVINNKVCLLMSVSYRIQRQVSVELLKLKSHVPQSCERCLVMCLHTSMFCKIGWRKILLHSFTWKGPPKLYDLQVSWHLDPFMSGLQRPTDLVSDLSSLILQLFPSPGAHFHHRLHTGHTSAWNVLPSSYVKLPETTAHPIPRYFNPVLRVFFQCGWLVSKIAYITFMCVCKARTQSMSSVCPASRKYCTWLIIDF
jgi:hypothetical protein